MQTEIHVRFDPGHPFPHIFRRTISPIEMQRWTMAWNCFLASWDERPRGTETVAYRTRFTQGQKPQAAGAQPFEESPPDFCGKVRVGALKAFEALWLNLWGEKAEDIDGHSTPPPKKKAPKKIIRTETPAVPVDPAAFADGNSSR